MQFHAPIQSLHHNYLATPEHFQLVHVHMLVKFFHLMPSWAWDWQQHVTLLLHAIIPPLRACSNNHCLVSLLLNTNNNNVPVMNDVANHDIHNIVV